MAMNDRAMSEMQSTPVVKSEPHLDALMSSIHTPTFDSFALLVSGIYHRWKKMPTDANSEETNDVDGRMTLASRMHE